MRRTLAQLFEDSGVVHRSRFCVGGISVQVAGLDNTDVALGSSLELFRVQEEAWPADIDMQLRWVSKMAPSLGRRVFDSGSVWRLYEDERELQFDFRSAAFGTRPYKRLLVDAQFRWARLDMSEECFRDVSDVASPLDYPLDELLIMHRLTQEKAIELHGCGIVGPGGESNLFVGHSGAGKSTTTRLWVEMGGVEVLSDDRIIVRRDCTVRDAAVVGTPFEAGGSGERQQVLRLRDSSASRRNRSAQDDKERRTRGSAQDDKERTKRGSAQDDKRQRSCSGRIRMYGTPWHGEAKFASPGSALLGRIFILEHGRGNVVTRLSRSQAVAELFARSFVPFHRHEYLESALQFLEEVAEEVPVYRYAFEPTPKAVERILEFRD